MICGKILDNLVAEMPMMLQVLMNVRFNDDTYPLITNAVCQAETALKVCAEISKGQILLQNLGLIRQGIRMNIVDI